MTISDDKNYGDGEDAEITDPGPDRRGWRCFHCDEFFTDRKAAWAHFGPSEIDDPLCKIAQVEGGLASYVRQIEEELRRYRAEDSDKDRELMQMEAKHKRDLIREEERGYENAMRDLQVEKS